MHGWTTVLGRVFFSAKTFSARHSSEGGRESVWAAESRLLWDNLRVGKYVRMT